MAIGGYLLGPGPMGPKSESRGKWLHPSVPLWHYRVLCVTGRYNTRTGKGQDKIPRD